MGTRCSHTNKEEEPGKGGKKRKEDTTQLVRLEPHLPRPPTSLAENADVSRAPISLRHGVTEGEGQARRQKGMDLPANLNVFQAINQMLGGDVVRRRKNKEPQIPEGKEISPGQLLSWLVGMIPSSRYQKNRHGIDKPPAESKLKKKC